MARTSHCHHTTRLMRDHSGDEAAAADSLLFFLWLLPLEHTICARRSPRSRYPLAALEHTGNVYAKPVQDLRFCLVAWREFTEYRAVITVEREHRNSLLGRIDNPVFGNMCLGIVPSLIFIKHSPTTTCCLRRTYDASSTTDSSRLGRLDNVPHLPDAAFLRLLFQRTANRRSLPCSEKTSSIAAVRSS